MQTKFLSCVESRVYDHGQIYARFHLGTFFRGQALTVANALRRTLLAEIPGLVITSVKFQGSTHEFATLPGVQESVLDIVLNLKQLVFFHSLQNINLLEEHQFPIDVFLTSHGPTEVTGANLQLPYEIGCVNPTSHIATLSPSGELSLEFQLRMINPKDFILQQENAVERKFEKGRIFCLDTVPTPIRKINYLIHELDSKKESEYISLEIWTDGSIQPTQALRFALKKLTKLFFDFADVSQDSLIA